MIEQYDTFNTKGFTDELIFGDFNYQPIPSDYYNFLNDYKDSGDNDPRTPVDNALPENKLVEYEVVPNYEDINNEITIINDYYSLASDIEPLQNQILVIEGV